MTSDWYQQALTPAQVYEINIRVGVIPSEDHAQVLAEMKDPTNGVLLAQWSMPHTNMHGLRAAVQRAKAKALEWLDGEVDPF